MADSSDDYEVGYRRPPRETRFKPGQSGNPGGKRKTKKGVPLFEDTLIEVALREITISQDGRTRKSTPLHVAVERLVAGMMANPSKNFKVIERIAAIARKDVLESKGGEMQDHAASIRNKLLQMRERTEAMKDQEALNIIESLSSKTKR